MSTPAPVILKNCTLYNADNMAILKATADKYFDVAIVDPPYGIDIASTSKIGKRSKTGNFTTYKPQDWDNSIPPPEYFKELFRVSKTQIICGGNYFTEHLPPSRGWIIWDKLQPAGISFAMAELIWTSRNESMQIVRISTSLSKNNVSNNPSKAKLAARFHPTTKPVELYNYLFNRYVKPGDRVLDTHLGSGNIVKTALKFQQCEFTGIEINEYYFNEMLKRLEVFNQQNLIEYEQNN